MSRHTVTLCFGEIVTKIPTKTWCLSSLQVACQRSRKVDQICSFSFVSHLYHYIMYINIYIYINIHVNIYVFIYLFIFYLYIIQTYLVVGLTEFVPSFIFFVAFASSPQAMAGGNVQVEGHGGVTPICFEGTKKNQWKSPKSGDFWRKSEFPEMRRFETQRFWFSC